MTVQYPTTAPAKALTAGEQKNLKALIENDYRRARYALGAALTARYEEITREAEELFPDALIAMANDALAQAMDRVRDAWKAEFIAVAQSFPGLRISRHYSVDLDEDNTPELDFPRPYVGYPGKELWVAARRAEAQKAHEEATNLLNAQELEAQRTVLVRGVGSQEALDVLNEIPAAADLFTNRVLELEGQDG